MTNTPAGWYPDSENPGQQRYWDGSAWTEHRHSASGPAPEGGGPGTPDNRPWFKKKRFAIPLGVVVVLFLIGIAGGGDTGTSTDKSSVASDVDNSAAAGADALDELTEAAPEPESHEPTVSANAADMIKEFQDNELQADAKYKDQWLQVSGVVNKIDTEMFNSKKYVLNIGTGSDWDFLTVNCHDMSQAELSSLTTGNSVTVIGEFEDGGDLGVELNKCRLG